MFVYVFRVFLFGLVVFSGVTFMFTLWDCEPEAALLPIS